MFLGMSWATLVAAVVVGAVSCVYWWFYHLPGKRSLNPESAAHKKLFEAILDEFANSRCFSFPSDISPNLFVLYAHNNKKEGAAHDACVRQLITWLGKIHAQTLSDQHPLPLFSPRVEGTRAIGNILANQMCLLPPSRARGETPLRSSVDKIVVCGSEVLEAYCRKPTARAYVEDIVRICANHIGRPTETKLESIIQNRVQKECEKGGFHHVLTELAFIEVRAHRRSETHDLLPVVLNQTDPDEPLMQYLPCFRGTDVKLKLKSSEPSSLHTLFFKLLKRLYPENGDFINPFEEFYNLTKKQLHDNGSGRVVEKDFANIVDSGIERAHEEYRKKCGVFAGTSVLQNYTAKLSDKTSRILEHVSTAEQREILDWVSTVPTSEIHGKYRDHGTKRIEGTCEWVIEDAKFCQWHKSEKSALLWLNGEMGTGKSYCTSRVIDWVRDGLDTSDNDEGFAFFYCNKQDRDRSQAKGILRNIVRQLAIGPFKTRSIHTSVERTVHDLWKKHKTQGIGSTFAEWEACLVALIETYPRTTIVLDALDECGYDDDSQGQDLIKLLVNLVKRDRGDKSIKLFVSSRPQDDVRRHLGVCANIGMQERPNADDIANFVRIKISEHHPWSEYPQEFQDEMVQGISAMSGDMFLLANLQVHQLRKYTLQSVLKSHLKKLPGSLNNIYREIYREATSDPDERKYLNKALRWVLCAARPLTTKELLFAISQEFESDIIKRQYPDLNEALLRRWTHNLLSLENTPGNGDSPRPGVWRLAHQAVAEFLQESSDCTMGLAHCEAGKVCLLLLIDIFGSDYPGLRIWSESQNTYEKDEEFTCSFRGYKWARRHRPLTGTLADYATYAWPTHICAQDDCKAPGVDNLSRTLQAFLGQPQAGSPAYQRWIEHAFSRALWLVPGWSIFRFRRMQRPIYRRKRATTPMLFATHLGIYTCLSDWWCSPDINYNVAYDLGYVWWPSASSIVKFPDKLFSLVSLACAHNETAIMKHLLERNVQVNTTIHNHVPPLVAAVVGGWVELVDILIKHGADICSPFTTLYGHIISFAIRSNSINVLEFLMQQPGLSQAHEIESILTSLDFEDFQSAQAIAILVAKNVDVNIPLKVGTLLLAAASNGWEEMVKCLISKGAALNVGASFGKYDNVLDALISSHRKASQEMIALFVEDGAQINGRILIEAWRAAKPVGTWWDESGNHIKKRKELLLMLLEYVPDLDETWHRHHRYGYQTSALIEAATKGELELVRLLSKHGANVNLRVESRNALESVFHNILSDLGSGFGDRFDAKRTMINLLLKEGASLDNLEGDHLNEALAAAAYAGWEDLVKHFLHLGASPCERLSQERFGLNTALAVAAASEQPRVPLIINILLSNETSLKDKYEYYVATSLIFDRIFREVLPDVLPDSTYPGYDLRWLRTRDSGDLLKTAIVLARNYAVWDRDFTQWVKLLRSRKPYVWEQNTQDLSDLGGELAQNKARFFEKFPLAGSLDEWRVKDAGSLEELERKVKDAASMEEWRVKDAEWYWRWALIGP